MGEGAGYAPGRAVYAIMCEHAVCTEGNAVRPMQDQAQPLRIRIFRLTPARIVMAGFAALALAGGCLLALPISSAPGAETRFTDALFTSVSAICSCTVLFDTAAHWTLFGKVVILLLIQTGALGVMSVAALFAAATGLKPGLAQRLAMRESIGQYGVSEIAGIFKKVLAATFAIEGAGAVLLGAAFIPQYGWLAGAGMGAFHAVVSFCNAGFDLLGGSGGGLASLTGHSGDWYLLAVTAVLIVLGGLGYIALSDVFSGKRFSRWEAHTKIVLAASLALVLLGAAGYFAAESGASMRGMTAGGKVLNAFFQSVAVRTAGFNTVPVNDMSGAGKLLTMALMFVGGAPGSTAGGIKVTTLFILMLAVANYIRGRSETHAFGRNIPDRLVMRSAAVLLAGLAFVAASAMALLLTGCGSLSDALFEAASAFGTVGLTTGIVPGLSDAGKYTLMVTMLAGRIGALTAIAAFSAMRPGGNGAYKYPDGRILVG
jgi:trk system potassium uptake protein TrkH